MTIFGSDASKLSPTVFQHLAFILENEMDWPQLSAITGYMNSTWVVTQGPTRSIYNYLWNRNKCNFRDYQNIGVNGRFLKPTPVFVSIETKIELAMTSVL